LGVQKWERSHEKAKRIYLNRAAGGNRYHRDSNGDIDTDIAESQRAGKTRNLS
jgi:hypothetical protein